MISLKIFNIFKKGSRTYFLSSLFFPKKIRDDVFILYAFVRVADDYVDKIDQDKKSFLSFKKAYLKKDKYFDEVVTSYLSLEEKLGFKRNWTISFLNSMESDLKVKKYENFSQLEDYIYGSADVVGLMMAKILGLSEKSFPYAKKLGSAMQLANFIRDINFDLSLKRIYLPQNDLNKYGLASLDKKYILKNVNKFEKLVRFECDRYFKIQKQAEKGFKFIPKRSLIAVKTASDMYFWTIKKIFNDPLIVYKKQLKPSSSRIIYQGVKNIFYCKRCQR